MNKKFEKILIFSIDFITINIAWAVYYALRVQSGWFNLLIMPEFLAPMLVIYLYWLLIFTFVGMYRTWFAASRFDEISTLFKASFFGIFVLFFIIFIDDYIHGVSSTSRILIFIYWGLFLTLVGSGRIFIRSFQRNLLIKGIGRKKTFIVGMSKKVVDVYNQLIEHPALGLDFAGFISIGFSEKNKSYDGVNSLGSIDDIAKLIDEYDVKEIILALEKSDDDTLINLISRCESKNVGIKIVPDLYSILSGQVKTSQIYGIPLIDIMPELMPEWEKKLKRIFDMIISFLILIITLPVTILTSIAIKLDSKGAIFFMQERCGLDGTIFKIIKFRSMKQDAEKLTGPVWSQKDDPRITGVGKIIRKVRIDEIPQMLNVLKGEMSIVGPRPERLYFVEMLTKQIPYYKRRLKVRPGITGWAQVKHKYDESIEDVKAKLRYDLFYIENMSIRMDIKILFRTIFVVVLGKGHYN